MIPINIWIVEDEPGFRRTLQRMLNREKDITCDRVFPSCAKLFDAVATHPLPDMVLMDLGLPGMGGVEGIRKLSALAPNLAVIVLTVFSDKKKVMESLDAGAAGYLLKTATPEEIIQGLQQVFFGGAALSPKVAKLVVEETRKPSGHDQYRLSNRELDVLEQLALDHSVQEIADILGISPRTVSFHLTNIYRKLEVHSQTGAVAKALRSRII